MVGHVLFSVPGSYGYLTLTLGNDKLFIAKQNCWLISTAPQLMNKLIEIKSVYNYGRSRRTKKSGFHPVSDTFHDCGQTIHVGYELRPKTIVPRPAPRECVRGVRAFPILLQSMTHAFANFDVVYIPCQEKHRERRRPGEPKSEGFRPHFIGPRRSLPTDHTLSKQAITGKGRELVRKIGPPPQHFTPIFKGGGWLCTKFRRRNPLVPPKVPQVPDHA